MKEIKQPIPGGCEFDRVEDGYIYFKPKERVLPTSWEHYCELTDHSRETPLDARFYPKSELVWAAIAQRKLWSLVQYYRGGWVPDCGKENDGLKYQIRLNYDEISVDSWYGTQQFLTFQSQYQAEHFLEHHRDLIQQAKPLLWG